MISSHKVIEIITPDGSAPPFIIKIEGKSLLIETQNSNLVGLYQVLLKGCYLQQVGIYLQKIRISFNTPPFMDFKNSSF